jgi:arsenate reductase-like glutaredoxin family protein
MFMNIEKNELLLIYDSNDMQDRAILAYAKSVKDQVVKEVDIRKHTFTEAQFEQIATILDSPILDLIDQQSASYSKVFQGVELTEEGALTALKKNSDLLRTPIAVYNDMGKMIKSSYDLIKEGMIEE